jgi:enamine deaminase RidA (YjgF/YER057c/UK114 family)
MAATIGGGYISVLLTSVIMVGLDGHPQGKIRRDHEAAQPLLWRRAREPRQGRRMTSSRQLVSSGSPLEPEIGFSRAVRSGPYVCVAGTAPIAEGGGVAARGDVYGQAVRCLDIAEQALREAGASPADVVRTRVMLTDITQWREAARAHAERFAQVRPACTFIEVSRFVDQEWLVEFELDAVVPG